MNTLKRFIFNAPVALAVTIGLGLGMAGLVHVEYTQLADKPEKLSFEVNADIVDVDITEQDSRLEDFERVTPPPAPPVIERATARLPTVPIADLGGALPIFGKPKLNPLTVSLIVSDKDAQPLVRFEPIMPPRAQKSGHCKVRFNVSAQGKPYEVEALYCTQALFKRATIKAVEKWQYNPKIQDGVPATRRGVETLITFNLTDERDQLIPE